MKRLVFFLSLLFLASCDRGEGESIAEELDYFPLQIGFYQIYQVTETRYQLGVSTESTFQLKSIVSDSYEDAAGSITYVIHRSTREDEESPWIAAATWSARYSNGELIVSEGSIPYVALKFPVREGLAWNGNSYNNEVNPNTGSGEDTYKVIGVNSACSVDTRSFPECVSVELEDNNEFIVYRDRRIDTYAKNVGLISREVIQLTYCTDQNRDCLGKQIVDQGIIYNQEILDYGME